jgi:hypothetical protein
MLTINATVLDSIHYELYTFLHFSLVGVPSILHISHWHTMSTEEDVYLHKYNSFQKIYNYVAINCSSSPAQALLGPIKPQTFFSLTMASRVAPEIS